MANNPLPQNLVNVIPDNFSGKPGLNDIKQSDYAALSNAWENIHQGAGMTINGDGANAQVQKNQFDEMLLNAIGSSPTFRELITRIGNSSGENINVDLRAGDAGVTGDSLPNGKLDLNDLYNLPLTAPAADPNTMTRNELLTHILAERYIDVATPLYNRLVDPALSDGTFQHNYGIAYENGFRQERGQLPVISQELDPDNTGAVIQTYENPDGTTITSPSIQLDSSLPGKFWEGWDEMKNQYPSKFDPSIPDPITPATPRDNNLVAPENNLGTENNDSNDLSHTMPFSGENTTGMNLGLQRTNIVSDPGAAFPAALDTSVDPSSRNNFLMNTVNSEISQPVVIPDSGENSIFDGMKTNTSPVMAVDHFDTEPDNAFESSINTYSPAASDMGESKIETMEPAAMPAEESGMEA